MILIFLGNFRSFTMAERAGMIWPEQPTTRQRVTRCSANSWWSPQETTPRKFRLSFAKWQRKVVDNFVSISITNFQHNVMVTNPGSCMIFYSICMKGYRRMILNCGASTVRHFEALLAKVPWNLWSAHLVNLFYSFFVSNELGYKNFERKTKNILI